MISFSQIKAGIVSTSAAAVSRQLSTLVLYGVAAHILGPEPIGIFTLASTLLLLFEYAIFDSLSEAIVQRGTLTPQHIGAGLALAFCAAALALAIGLAIGIGASSILDVPELTSAIAWMIGPVALLCLTSVHSGILRRLGFFHFMSALSAAAAVTASLVGIVLLCLGAGLASLLAYFAVERLILSVGTVLGTRPPSVSAFSRRNVYDLFSYAIVIAGQRAVYFLRNHVDRISVAYLWGPDVLGIYQLAVKLTDSLQAVLLSPASKLFFVIYARLADDPDKLRETFLASLRTASFFTIPALLGLSAVAPEVVPILFGDSWNGSVVILQVLAVASIPPIASVMSGTLLAAIGHPGTLFKLELLALVLGILPLFALAQFGVAWIAAAVALRDIMIAAMYLIVLRSIVSISFRDVCASFLPCLAASGLMLLLLFLLRPVLAPALSPVLLVSVLVVTGIVFYGALMSGISARGMLPIRSRVELLVRPRRPIQKLDV